MEPVDFSSRDNPEMRIQEQLEAYLRVRGWYVQRTHGSKFQSGLPDIYAFHPKYKQRWIEVKLPGMKGSKFTPAQLENFPKMIRHKCYIWILTAADEREYNELFNRKEGNFLEYLVCY